MKFKLALFIFLAGYFAQMNLHAEETKWVLFAQDPEKKWFDYYYDAGHFLGSTNSIIGVWIMVVPKGKEAKDFLLEARRIRAFHMEGYEDYQYTVTKMEINCPEKTKAVFESKDYGKKGKILDKVNAVRTNWKEIIPGSVEEVYHAFLCKKR